MKLGDKNEISPVPEWQESLVKIKYDAVEKQQEGQPNGRAVQAGANPSPVCPARKLSLSFPSVTVGVLLTFTGFP